MPRCTKESQHVNQLSLSPMISIPYRERTLYIPQQNYGSESRTPDLMMKITDGGTALTSSHLDTFTESSEINTFLYDIKRDVQSDSSRNVHTNAQTFLSDVTFIAPAEPYIASVIQRLLNGTMIESIEFAELQNTGKVNQARETTTFEKCYFTHFQRFTTSWGGNSRINVFVASFRSLDYAVSIQALDTTGNPGNMSAAFDFIAGKDPSAS